jgi:hypothetical protein
MTGKDILSIQGFISEHKKLINDEVVVNVNLLIRFISTLDSQSPEERRLWDQYVRDGFGGHGL